MVRSRSAKTIRVLSTSAILFSSLLALCATAPAAAVELGANGEVTLTGDFRFRLEQDWDSRRADGAPRDDRGRARVRLRLGLGWQISDVLNVGFRARSGSETNHQSPHLTIVDFDGNDTGDADFNPDKWFLQAKNEHLWGWVGRNGFPFWKQNEFLWDDDATLAGAAGGWTGAAGEHGNLSLNFGYLSPPVGMKSFTGSLAAGQLVYQNDRSPLGLTLAAGLYAIDADPGDPDAAVLANGNGLRDYSIVMVSAQARRTAGGRPLVLGLDYLDNGKSYGQDDPYAFANRTETDGYAASIAWGSSSGRGDWLLGYRYAKIGALAINGSYGQDDWVRWGSSAETETSDLKGHELRFGFGLGATGSLLARLYLVEAITSVQDGKRFRLDYNLTF